MLIALTLALMLVQTASPAPPSSAPPAEQPVPAAPAETQTPEQTLAGLQTLYASSCGQTGIVYHAYDDLCDGLRRQIHDYQVRSEREAAAAAKSRKSPSAPSLQHPAPN